jgi:DNA modification methylase
VKGRIEEGVAAYPDEIPRRLIRLFSFMGETVLDPFLGSGTTAKVAKELRRNSVGYELDLELEKVIQRKLKNAGIKTDRLEFSKRTDGKHLRTKLQKMINAQRTVTRKNKS